MTGIVFFKCGIHFPIPDVTGIPDQGQQQQDQHPDQYPVVTFFLLDIPACLNAGPDDPPEHKQSRNRPPNIVTVPDHCLYSLMVGMLIQHHKRIICQRHKRLHIKDNYSDFEKNSQPQSNYPQHRKNTVAERECQSKNDCRQKKIHKQHIKDQIGVSGRRQDPETNRQHNTQ